MSTNWQELLVSELDAMGVDSALAADGRLALYLSLLEHWNRTINLTKLDPRARVRRLVVEPLWVGMQLTPSGRYVDIGSGNGSPAIPWALAFEFETVALVEARVRRATFLRVLARRLRLMPAVSVLQVRFQAAGEALAGVDWATLQGVRLDTALLEGIRALNPNATIVWYTRDAAAPEVPTRRISIPGSDREALVFGRE